MSKIATSSFFVELPANCARISIARSAPRGQSGFKVYRKLAPGAWFRTVSAAEYRSRYFNEILGLLDPAQVVSELIELADGKIPALLCWEPPTPGDQWCHRSYVSCWLYEKLGIEVYEYGEETFGCAWSHPKIPPEFRR